MNIILEGPDDAGKSTLANKINKGGEWKRFHNGLHMEPFNEYLDQAVWALKNPGEDCLWDRFWPSNLVYGPIHGGKMITPGETRLLQAMTIHLNAIVVLCLPPWETVRVNWKARGDAELVKEENKMHGIYREYAPSAFGVPQIVIDPFEMPVEEVLMRVARCAKWTE